MTSLYRRPDVKWWEVKGEAVLYDPVSGEGHVLNDVAYAVWRQCDGETSLGAIELGLIETFPNDVDAIRVDVPALAQRLVELGLAKDVSALAA